MKSQRRIAFRVALVSCLAFTIVSLIAIRFTSAQEQKDQKGQKPEAAKPQPTPEASPSPAATQQQPTQQGREVGPVEIANTDLVTFTVTVTDSYGRYVSGLDKKAFKIFDDKEEQEIQYFSDDDAPVSVGIIFDVSGSMGGEKIRKAREALSRFIQTSHDSDEYFLIAFNSRAQLLLDKTRDGDAVLNKLTFVDTKGNTALYDACYLGVEKVTRGAHQKRALLLISDGQDNNSRYTFNNVRRMLKESDVVVYSIGILGGNDPGSSLGMEGQSILDELSAVSGGKAFFPNTGAEMDELFERIALELRHQYSIGYKPKDFKPDGRWHKLKVKVTPPRGLPRLFARSRDGYYAITNPK
ncbi:MAG: VWA domain-containing protein [Acidobacteria bacterium]|nr:MAG: VWA domain-containing protein [Acidobacteriota bacterium]